MTTDAMMRRNFIAYRPARFALPLIGEATDDAMRVFSAGKRITCRFCDGPDCKHAAGSADAHPRGDLPRYSLMTYNARVQPRAAGLRRRARHRAAGGCARMKREWNKLVERSPMVIGSRSPSAFCAFRLLQIAAQMQNDGDRMVASLAFRSCEWP